MDADWVFLCRTRGDSSVPKGVLLLLLLLLLPGKIKRWWKIKDIIIIYIYIDISCWFTVAAAILPWLWFVDSDLLSTTGLHQETDWFTSLMFKGPSYDIWRGPGKILFFFFPSSSRDQDHQEGSCRCPMWQRRVPPGFYCSILTAARFPDFSFFYHWFCH